MGANQSGNQHQISDNNAQTNNQHSITVVNPNPELNDNRETIVLPQRVSPILSIEGHNIDSRRHGPEVQLNNKLWMDFVTTIDRFSNSRADLVATRQSQLQEKIIFLDGQVQRFTDSYVNDKHKALAKLNDDCRKMEDITKLLEKCTIQSRVCVDMLNKLNFLLPTENKLESIDV